MTSPIAQKIEELISYYPKYVNDDNWLFKKMLKEIFILGQQAKAEEVREICESLLYDEEHVNQTGRAVNDAIDKILSATSSEE